MSTGPLPNICKANKNLSRMLGITKLRVHLVHTKEALKFIFSETLAPFTIIGAEFNDQHVKTIRSKQELVELDTGDYIPIILKHRERIKSQPSLFDDLNYSENSPQPSPIVQVAKTLFFSRTPKHGYRSNLLALAQPRRNYTRHSTKNWAVAFNEFICVKPNVPSKILIANMGDQVPELVENQKAAIMMPHSARAIPTEICATELLGLTAEASKELTE